jgi:hypothetical protein
MAYKEISMKAILAISILSLTSACATMPASDSKKHEVTQCVKEMRGPDDNIADVFEVCRQIHGLKKVRDAK